MSRKFPDAWVGKEIDLSLKMTHQGPIAIRVKLLENGEDAILALAKGKKGDAQEMHIERDNIGFAAKPDEHAVQTFGAGALAALDLSTARKQ